MTALLAIHPVLGGPMPPATVMVDRTERDWDWAGNGRRRRGLVRLVLQVKGRTCHLCGLPGATSADHLIPWAHGGRNVLENLEPAHYSCNSARRDLTLASWFIRHPVHRTRARRAPSREW